MHVILRPQPRLSARASQGIRDIAHAALSGLASVGFTCVRGFIAPAVMAELHAEARRNRSGAKAVSGTSGHGYRAHLSGLGDTGRAFLAGGTMTELIGTLFGVRLVPDKVASCYTYYQPGDFLGAHIDHAEQCLVTAILYLDVVRPASRSESTGLELRILEEASSGESTTTRAILPTEAGALVLGLGSMNWHERPTLQDGEYLTAMTACYSMPPAA